MPFSFRHFLRQTPSLVLKAFFDDRSVEFGGAVDWQAAEHMIARQIAEAMDGMSGEQVAPLISGLERAHALSDEHGIRALVNAAEDPEVVLATLEQAETDQERALRVLVESPKVFERAEDIRYFDYRVEGSYGRRFRAQQDATVSRDPADIGKFQCAVGAYFRSIDGSGRSCVAEVIDRNADGTVQVTLFVEGLAATPSGLIRAAYTGARNDPRSKLRSSIAAEREQSKRWPRVANQSMRSSGSCLRSSCSASTPASTAFGRVGSGLARWQVAPLCRPTQKMGLKGRECGA